MVFVRIKRIRIRILLGSTLKERSRLDANLFPILVLGRRQYIAALIPADPFVSIPHHHLLPLLPPLGPSQPPPAMASLTDLVNLSLSDTTEKIIAEYIWYAARFPVVYLHATLSLFASLVRKNRSCLMPGRLLMASPHPEHDLERGFGRPPHAVPHLLFYFGDQSSGEALFVDSSSSKNLLFWLVYSPMNIWLQFRICSERAGEMRSTLLTFVCPAAGGSSQRQSLALCSSGPSPATAPLIWCYDCITGHRQMNLLSRRSNRMSYALIDSPGASIISTFF